MKAVILDAPGQLRVGDVDIPNRKEGEALVEIKAVGICGSDLRACKGKQPFLSYPRVLGHELAGVIEEIDDNERGLKIGDKVVIEPLIRCGKCYPCRVARYNCCVDLQVLGVHTDGGMAEYISVPIELLHKSNSDLPFSVLALAEPLTIGSQAVSRGRVHKKDRVAIIGAGPIGLMALQSAKSIGEVEVAIVDILDSRLQLAKRLGADLTINAEEVDVEEAVLDFTSGEGASVVIEAVGVAETIESTIQLVSSAGRIVFIGLGADKVCFSPHLLIKKEVDILASRTSCFMFPRALELIEEGKVDAASMITHRYKLEEAEEAFKFIEEHPDKIVKVVLENRG